MEINDLYLEIRRRGPILLEACDKCSLECDQPCAALGTLTKLYVDHRTEEKTEIIRKLRKELSLVDFEIADDLKVLGEKIIKAMPELSVIRDFDVRIGYVRSYEVTP
jgi:hypothetical protein